YGMFNSDATRLAGLSGTVGNQATQDRSGLGALGQTLAGTGTGLAGAFSTLGSQDLNNQLLASNALLQTGNQQQNLEQNRLNASFAENAARINDPYAKAGWAAQTQSAYRPDMATNSNIYGQTSGSASSSGSPFGTILGGLSAVGSLIPGIGTGISAISNLLGGAAGAASGPLSAATAAAGQVGRARGGPVGFAHGGYFGLDEASTPSFIHNPGYFKMMQPYAFSA
ncbi:MAG: hypothetical protein V4597_17510, partial [Pseudomonadota bacterium]